MGELFAYVFVAAWFIFWGYILLTNPEVFFRFQKQGDDRLKGIARVGTKVAVMGMKAAAKAKK